MNIDWHVFSIDTLVTTPFPDASSQERSVRDVSGSQSYVAPECEESTISMAL